jgi:hypothetical protein
LSSRINDPHQVFRDQQQMVRVARACLECEVFIEGPGARSEPHDVFGALNESQMRKLFKRRLSCAHAVSDGGPAVVDKSPDRKTADERRQL